MQSVSESQIVDAGQQLVDVYEIVYTLPDRPGSFTLEVPKSGDAVANARAAIAELESEVSGIYGL